MSMRTLCLCLATALVAGSVVAEDAKKEFAAKCVVAAKRDAKQDKSADYKEGKVYFCCDNCKGKFTSNPKDFAVPANMQLVSTEQYHQVKCPLSGGKIDETKTVEVDGVKVAFCCGNCQGKVAAATGDAQKELVFSDTAFGKGFEPVKKD